MSKATKTVPLWRKLTSKDVTPVWCKLTDGKLLPMRLKDQVESLTAKVEALQDQIKCLEELQKSPQEN